MADIRDIKDAFTKRSSVECLPRPIEGVMIGKIARMDEMGNFLVDIPGSDQGPVKARFTSSAAEKMLRQTDPEGLDVLLAFENNDPGLPIIIDSMFTQAEEKAEQSSIDLEAQKPDEVIVDRKRVIIDAEEEIILQCGVASITLNRSGRVVIKGRYLISQASGANRIKGYSVQFD